MAVSRQLRMIDMTTDDTGQAPEGGEDPRLTSLEERLKDAHHSEAERTAPKAVGNAFTGKGVSQGNRVLSALIGAPLGGLIVGFALDQLFGTRPWVMLSMLFFGIAAGFVQIWRISKERAE
ncbi:MAG: AtpZ/AtpI family protein [Novosphingobium sp.]|nr:AtpZ/AtpI family protein [Novosphingobium sp.]